MSNTTDLVTLDLGIQPRNAGKKASVLLVRPPYFTPWTPPLGIAILKSFLVNAGHHAQCFDFNADPELWGMHHKYFSILASVSASTSNDGYSKLWWIFNAHMLSYANGASPSSQRHVIETISPLYGVHVTKAVVDSLLPLVDRYFKRLTHLFDELDLSGFDYIGTSTYTTSLSSSLWLLRRAKDKRPEIKTVMGGGVFADDLALGSDNLDILLQEYPWIDHVVLGEGEKLLQQILDGTLSHKRVVSIADLNKATLAMQDVPIPDFTEFNLERYYNLTIEGARSCPFQCSFCSETIQWGEYRKKPVDKFVDQIMELSQRHNMREFFMGDSLMNPYLIPFADALMKRNANILYDGYLRADRPVTNRKFVKAWADSGLYRVRLGIESASVNVLKSMDKKTSPPVIAEVLKTLSNFGIRTTTYWIVGFPGETEQDFEDTCEFIRQNHQYIYELEAHPYYYYPYGQVGSRFYECESVYPEEVTNLTKFKVWEIIGANPPREVRYQRLDRISALANSLGLPNIYTMSERYQAEDRWRRLHPMAIEVFKAPAQALEVADQSRHLNVVSKTGKEDPGAILSYRMSVGKKLQPELMRQALAHIVDQQEMLRVTKAELHFVPTSINASQVDTAVRYFKSADGSSAAEQYDNVIAELAADLSSSPAVPLRVGVLEAADEQTEVFVVAHRGSLDTNSVTLIAEDICRIYEQLSAGRPPYMRAQEKTYAECAGQINAKTSLATGPACGAVVSFEATLDKRTIVGLTSSDGMRKTVTARFLTAALRTLAREHIESATVNFNPRILDRSAKSVVGPLSRVVAWPESPQCHPELLLQLEDVGKKLDKLNSNTRPASPTNDWWQSLINLEFLTSPAWMGLEPWKTQGFVLDSARLPWCADLQIVPAWTSNGLAVHVVCHEEDHIKTLAQSIAGALAAELATVVREDEARIGAELFWHEELGPVNIPSDGTVVGEIVSTTDESYGSVEIDLAAIASRLESNNHPFTLEAGLFAIYSLLAGRIERTNNAPLSLVFDVEGESQTVPVRLLKTGNPKCQDYIRIAGEKMRFAAEHSQLSAAILRKYSPRRLPKHGCMDQALIGKAGVTKALQQHSKTLDTILEFNSAVPSSARVHYLPGAITRQRAEEIVATIPVALERILDLPDIRINDILWGETERTALEQDVSVVELSHEFQFGD